MEYGYTRKSIMVKGIKQNVTDGTGEWVSRGAASENVLAMDMEDMEERR